MSIEFFKRNWQQLLCNILLFFIFIITYGKYGDVIVDSFREAYIPERMLGGSILYKNIFCIYAPLSYMINAVLFFIFGVKLQVLYFAGLLTTFGIINLTYKISENFLNKNISLAIVLFILSASVLSPNVFNYIFPYSYGILYGMFFILLAIFYTIKDKNILAFIFYSLAICCKYEFLLALPVLFWYFGKKNIVKNITAVLIPILLTFIPIIAQGVTTDNFIAQAFITVQMMSTKTIHWFYSISGLVFRPELIVVYLINIIKMALPLLLLFYFRNWISIVAVSIYAYFFLNQELFIYSFPLILILLAINFRKISRIQLFLVLVSLAVSMKIFFALTLMSYGIYFLPFALISMFLIIPKKIKTPLLILVICSSFAVGIKNYNILNSKNIKIESNKGIVYTSEYYGNSINELNKYLAENTKKSDKICVFPEGLITNFLTNRVSDDKFYSLIPLYIETFGEDIIISRFKLLPPKYIIISNYDSSNYYYSYFGQDYAKNVFDYIVKNYKYEKTIGKGFVFNIYKKM